MRGGEILGDPLSLISGPRGRNLGETLSLMLGHVDGLRTTSLPLCHFVFLLLEADFLLGQLVQGQRDGKVLVFLYKNLLLPLVNGSYKVT